MKTDLFLINIEWLHEMFYCDVHLTYFDWTSLPSLTPPPPFLLVLPSSFQIVPAIVSISCHLDVPKKRKLNWGIASIRLAVDMSEGTASWCEKTLPMPTVHGHIDSETGNWASQRKQDNELYIATVLASVPTSASLSDGL